jgi:hypothetical protein
MFQFNAYGNKRIEAAERKQFYSRMLDLTTTKKHLEYIVTAHVIKVSVANTRAERSSFAMDYALHK